MDRAGDVEPRVSVVIPCYNGERFIREAVESVLGQTYRNLEVIVVDDGSQDSSLLVLEEYSRDPRVVCLRHESNRGIPAARNTGLRAVRGQYVGFLDQDDQWMSHKLETQVAILDAGTADLGMVFTDVLIATVDGVNLGAMHGPAIPRGINRLSRRARLRAVFLHNFISLISALFRKECLDRVGGFDESITGGMDDNELCLRVVGAWEISYTNRPLAVHRVHSQNYSRNTERLAADAPAIMEQALRRHPELSDLRARKTASHHVRLARYYRDSGYAAGARAELRTAIASDRTWCRPYLLYLLSLTGRTGARLLELRRRLRRPRS